MSFFILENVVFFFLTKLCYLYSLKVGLLLFLINSSPLTYNEINIDRYNSHKQKLFGDPRLLRVERGPETSRSENCCSRQVVQAALLSHTEGEIYLGCLKISIYAQIYFAKGDGTLSVKGSLMKSSL